MLIIQPRGRHDRDEKLRAIGVGPGIGHAECVGMVVLQRRMELVLKLPAPNGLPARSVALGVPGLHHEALDDPVENVPVEVAVPRVHDKVLHAPRALLGEERDVDVAHGGVDDDGVGDAFLALVVDRGHGLFLAGLFVEHVAVVLLRRRVHRGAFGEEVEAVLLEGRGENCGVGFAGSRVQGGIFRGLGLDRGGRFEGLDFPLEQAEIQKTKSLRLTCKNKTVK